MPSHRKRPTNARLIILISIFVVSMFAFSYLLVPIFTYVCEKTGINGKNGLVAATAQSDMKAATRTVKVQFTSVLHGNLKFKFDPLQQEIMIHPGERKIIYFYAENNTGFAKTVQAVPSITPIDAARYMKKIECFCFTQQRFDKDEKAKMFVNFYIDPDLPDDIHEITLAYTLFDAGKFESQSKFTSKGRIRL
jgi:cytochrome c oxidase assembly protein subunit 11